MPTTKPDPATRCVFILYDGRAKSGDTDDASVIVIADSEAEASSDSEDWRDVDAVWYQYDLVNGEAVNERRRDDIGKGILL